MNVRFLRLRIVAVLVLCLGTAGTAFADVDCVGAPISVYTWGIDGGNLAVTLQSYPSSTWLLCSVDSTMSNITPDHCKAIMAMLLQGLAGQRSIDIQFSTYTDCTMVPSWSPGLSAYLKLIIAK